MSKVPEPAQRDLDACMHLLRHLDDPMALRRNPLVAPLFARARSQRSPRRAFAQQAQIVRSIVESAVETLLADTEAGDAAFRNRQYQIVRRCDLEREPRETVMSDLGISRRQFYRDRSSACAYLARCIVEKLRDAHVSPAFVVDLFEAAHERARALRYTGEVERSAMALREMVSQSASSRKKILPWMTLIDLLNDDCRGAEAAGELASLRSFAQGHAPAADYMRHIVALQEASVLWALGEDRRALDTDRATADKLGRLARCSDGPALYAAISLYLSRAQRAFLVGDYRASNEDLSFAGELLDRSERVPAVLRLRYLLMDGDRKIFSPGDLKDTAGPLSEVANVAQSQGNFELLSMALGDMALFQQTFGDLETACRLGRDSLALASGAPRGIRGYMLLNCAEIAAGRGRARDSIELATRAQKSFPERGVGSSISFYHTARALLALRDYAGARDAAEGLRENAASGGNPRLLGSGLRLLAQAYYGLGEVTMAHEHITAAILLLERYGQPFALRAAYLNSADITGHAEHRRMAREIAESFELTA